METKEEGEKMKAEDWKKLRQKEKLLKQAAEILHVSDKDLSRVVDRFLKEIEQ